MLGCWQEMKGAAYRNLDSNEKDFMVRPVKMCYFDSQNQMERPLLIHCFSCSIFVELGTRQFEINIEGRDIKLTPDFCLKHNEADGRNNKK